MGYGKAEAQNRAKRRQTRVTDGPTRFWRTSNGDMLGLVKNNARKTPVIYAFRKTSLVAATHLNFHKMAETVLVCPCEYAKAKEEEMERKVIYLWVRIAE